MDLSDKFKKKFGENIILSKCSENNCALKDLSKKDYVVISGDDIKKTDDEKSADCIIIDLNQKINNKYDVTLCELTSGKKNLIDVRNKFKSSGKLIINIMDDFDESIDNIYCLLLGKIIHNGKSISKKELRQSFRIEGYNKPIFHIQNEKCGFSIKDVY